jgi:predicted DNA-binding transcriptional regulator YafY
MEIFLKEKKEISSYDKDILEEFGCSQRTLERYLNDIENLYFNIIKIKKEKKNVWKLVKASDVFKEFIEKQDDRIFELFLILKEADPEIFKELEKGTLSKIAKRDESIFLFKHSIMEELRDEKRKNIFKNLKVAVKNREYRDIIYNYNEVRVEKNQICLKLLFIDNNWYLVVIDERGELKFKRLSFISDIKYSKDKISYKKNVDKYLKFLKEDVQNAMTRYDTKPKTATIKANPNIAKYFKKGMKKHLPSQKFKSKEADGSIIFTLKYTQPLEILPFIQKWLPDLIVLEPQELKKAYIKKLQEALKNHSSS